MMSLSSFARVAGGLAVLAGSFFGTLAALDWWDQRRSPQVVMRNLLPDPENLHTVIGQSAIAKFEAVGAGTAPRVYRLSSAGGSGEHYVGIEMTDSQPGSHVLLLEARRAGSARLRVQIFDSASNGAIGDIDLVSKSVVLAHGQGPTSRAEATPKGDWLEIQITAAMNTKGSRIIFQLLEPNGGTSFVAGAESVEIRAMRVFRAS